MIIELAPIFLRLLEKSSLSSKPLFLVEICVMIFKMFFLVYHTRSTIMKWKKPKKLHFQNIIDLPEALS